VNYWQLAKAWVGETTGLPDSTLHVLGGMFLLLAAAAVLRRVIWDWRPWLVLLLLEIANEVHDMLNPASGENRLGASLHDFWLTMLCPTLIALLGGWLYRNAKARER
jgi:hypothetical protein